MARKGSGKAPAAPPDDERRTGKGEVATEVWESLLIPLRTYSTANLREHWAVKAKRVKAERSVVRFFWPAHWRIRERAGLWRWPLRVTLIRRSPRALDDDNLRPALKAVRDEVADLLGLKSDRDSRVRWEYGQHKGEAAVVVTIEEGL